MESLVTRKITHSTRILVFTWILAYGVCGNSTPLFCLRGGGPSIPQENGTGQRFEAWRRRKSLDQFLQEETSRDPSLESSEPILAVLQLACQTISALVERSGLVDGTIGTDSESRALKSTARRLIVDALEYTGAIDVTADERIAEPWIGSFLDDDVPVVADRPTSDRFVVVEPLELDVKDVSAGTIFGIFLKNDDVGGAHNLEHLERGTNLMAAGYVIYAVSTVLVLSHGDGTVHAFTLDPHTREFILTNEHLRIPDFPGPQNRGSGVEPPGIIPTIVNDFLPPNQGSSLVTAVHQVLHHGASATRLPDNLRLVSQAVPLAFLIEQAGGFCHYIGGDIEPPKPQAGPVAPDPRDASSEDPVITPPSRRRATRVLEIRPSGLDQSVSIVLGRGREIEQFELPTS